MNHTLQQGHQNRNYVVPVISRIFHPNSGVSYQPPPPQQTSGIFPIVRTVTSNVSFPNPPINRFTLFQVSDGVVFRNAVAPGIQMPAILRSDYLTSVAVPASPRRTNLPALPPPKSSEDVETPQSLALFPRWKAVTQGVTSGSVIPSPRHGHKAVSINSKYVAIIGGGNEEMYMELHILNVETMEWSQPKTIGDAPLSLAAFGAVFDETSDRILLFGGMEEMNKYSNLLHELKYNKNLDVWEWHNLHPMPTCDKQTPSPRFGHSFTIVDDKVYLFGGLANVNYEQFTSDFFPVYLSDLFVLDINVEHPHGAWNMPRTTGERPCPRESHCAAWVKENSRNQLIICGGMNGRRLDDVYALDLDEMVWTRMPSSPRGLSLHTASLVGSRIFFFGGWTKNLRFNDKDQEAQSEIWECTNAISCFNIEKMTWEWDRVGQHPTYSPTPTPMPLARAGHCAFTVGPRIYIWGGRNGYIRDSDGRQSCFNDLWQLEVEPSRTPEKSSSNELCVSWPPVLGPDSYFVQFYPADS